MISKITQPLKVLVDTDGGVDDAAALWYLLTQPSIDVVGIVATGSSRSVETVVNAVANILEATGRGDVPLAAGLRAPPLASAGLRSGNYFHGDDGLGGFARIVAPLPSQGELGELWAAVSKESGPLVVLSLCALSSLAWACRIHADAVSRARHVAMAGAFREPGNVTATAELNVARDPVAAAQVLAAPWASAPTFVSLDVSNLAMLKPGLIRKIDFSNSAAARFLAGPLRHYRRAHIELNGGDAMPCHDLLAAMSLVHADLVTFEEMPVAIDTGNSVAAGSTIADERRFRTESAPIAPFRLARVARSVDVERFEQLVAAMFE